MIYGHIQQVLMKDLLRSFAVVDEVQKSKKSAPIEDRVRKTEATDDRQIIYQAFKIQKGVSPCNYMQYMQQQSFFFLIADGIGTSK